MEADGETVHTQQSILQMDSLKCEDGKISLSGRRFGM